MPDSLRDQFADAVKKCLHPQGSVSWRLDDHGGLVLVYRLRGRVVRLTVTRHVFKGCFTRDRSAWDAYGLNEENATLVWCLMNISGVPKHRIPDVKGKMVLSEEGKGLVAHIAESLAREHGIYHYQLGADPTEPCYER